MDSLINGLYGIPVAGFVFEFLGYLVAVLPSVAPIMLRVAAPLTLAALCGVVCERSGVVNIGIEGTMLEAAFGGWVVGVALLPVIGGTPSPIFGITLPLLIAFVAALGAAMLVSLLHAWLSISVRADQIISGTIVNIAAFGVTGYLNELISKSSPTSAGTFSAFTPPDAVVQIPLIGWVFNMFLNQGPITMSVLVIVVIMQILLFRSRWGLRTRAVGEHPKAAETVGIDVIRLRYRNVVLGGLLAGMGGAALSMELTNSFQEGMTAGRGFIGLAAMIIGRWSPLGAFGAALLFASATAVSQSITFAPPAGDLGHLLGAIPGQFWDALPYVVTVIVVAGLIGRSIPPAADGRPYEREAAT